MKDRRFQQIEPPDICCRPVNRVVTTFVASPAMNFLLGRIKQHNGAPNV
jgi:ABC-type sugar transport system ATPase subunit